MNRWFAEVKTVEELMKQYRELLKKYHSDNENGSIEATQEINGEYDRLFSVLRQENNSDSQFYIYDYNTENEAFKAVINDIIRINADVEIIGSWVWVHSTYEYRRFLSLCGVPAPGSSVEQEKVTYKK